METLCGERGVKKGPVISSKLWKCALHSKSSTKFPILLCRVFVQNIYNNLCLQVSLGVSNHCLSSSGKT